jgi:site-specific recombinase XerD
LLSNFIWYCHQNDSLQVQRLTAVRIRHFFWYLSTETHHWNSSSSTTKRLASPTTINGYFRTLCTFFNWLEREDLIVENPFKNLKTPRPDNKVIRALSSDVASSEIRLTNCFCVFLGQQCLRVQDSVGSDSGHTHS